MTRATLAAAAALGLAACTLSGPPPAGLSTPSRLVAPPPVTTADLDADARRWVEETLATLTLRQAVAQLVIPWIPGGYASESDPEFQDLLGWVERGLGGVSISIGVPDAYVAKLNRLQSRARVPLLVTSDFENGGPGMRIHHSYALPSLLPQGGGTSFPPTMAFGAAGDEDLAFEYGRITAVEARAVGVHWLFAPVLDVNSNPDNPVINVRSFGEDPEAVGRLGASFIRGARAGGALSTAKHFPGHGDTRTDSHIELPVIGADRDRLDRVELFPFQMAVDEGVDAVMTAHVAVPGVLGDNRPATMSPELMTDVLRGEMGFGGILFTDALRMGAITDGYGAGEAAVLSLEAGSDVILAPDGIGVTIDAVTAAVESGRVSRARIDTSVRRLLEAKARLGLHRGRRVDPTAVAERVGTAEHRAVAERAATAALTLVRDRDRVLPLPWGANVLSVTYARPDALLAGRTFDASLRSHARRVATARVGPDTPWATYDSLLHAARVADAVIVGAYVPPRSGVGSVGVPPGFRAFVERLDRMDGPRAAVLSFGSSYLLSAFPETGTYLVAWGGWEVSQRAAARAVAGLTPITGRLPISIPPLHAIGEGLERAATGQLAEEDEERPDPLREAGFIPGADRGEAAEEGDQESPAGGPGRWRPGPTLPSCTHHPASALAPPPPDGANDPADLADEFCLAGRAVVSPREVDPARVGMSADSLAALDNFILGALADSAASGAALAVLRRGQLVRLRGYGRLDWDPDAPPVTPASIFDLASLTKVVGTTSAVMILTQRGLIALDDLVVDYLSWWDDGDPAKTDVTIRDLLLHRAGLPPFRRFFLEMEGRDAYEDAIGSLPLDHPPGDTMVYSDIGLMTASFIVEAVSGQPLDAFLRDEVWRPLGMADTDFTPAPSRWDRVATTEFDAAYRGYHVHGVVHDENAHAIGGVAGHAGLFSSARDLAVFAQMMLDRGVAPPCTADQVSGLPCNRPRFTPVSIFAQGSVDRFTRRQSEASTRALGWDTPSPRSSAGDYFSARSFGHTGYTGTSLWIDPTQELAVVLLTNRVNPTRENSRHVPLRRGVHDRVARAILDTPPGLRNP
ncbi:MAG: serine hydrolase [Gemmatimonadota bacterium]|nr:serine hydrolase [Gemmatimonadota bacterium]